MWTQKDRKKLTISLSEIGAVSLGGASLPYIVLGALHDFNVRNAGGILLVAVILLALQCWLMPERRSSIILSAITLWGTATLIIVSGAAIIHLFIERSISNIEIGILVLGLSIYLVKMICNFSKKAKKRKIKPSN